MNSPLVRRCPELSSCESQLRNGAKICLQADEKVWITSRKENALTFKHDKPVAPVAFKLEPLLGAVELFMSFQYRLDLYKHISDDQALGH